MTVATPTEIGARAEAAVASALVRAGKPVFLPAFGVNSRVDLVYEEDAALVRVQCKTSRLVGNVLIFRTCSNTKNLPRDYAGRNRRVRRVLTCKELGLSGAGCQASHEVLPAATRAHAQRPEQARVVASDHLLGPP